MISDPNRAFMVMKDSMKSRIKLQNKTTARNFLRKCLKKGVGTNEIESLARKNLYGINAKTDKSRNKDIEKEVKRLLKLRLVMAEKEMLKLKFEWIKQKNAMMRTLREMTATLDIKYVISMFNQVEQEEVSFWWKERSKVLNNRVLWLMNKYKSRSKLKHDDNLKDVKVSDNEVLAEKSRLEVTDDDNFVVFGNIILTEEEKAYLNLPAKFREYERISARKLEVEIETHCVKQRYELIDDDNVSDDLTNEERETIR
jgi:hypothetical protein